MRVFLFVLMLSMYLTGCKDDNVEPKPEPEPEPGDFYFGADLSYANQILDHNGIYKDEGQTRSPFKIFKDHGTNLVRLRLWHNPIWTKEVYDPDGTQMYNDFADVEKSITLSKEQGLKVLLDFHYSDTWADPNSQDVPAAWTQITSLSVLKDSVYNYTFKTLKRLKDKNLMPEFVQLGNETNCGMLYTNAPAGFPKCDVCGDVWTSMGEILKQAIQAVRAVDAQTKIILHVADPKNVQWWFDNITQKGGVTDFDIVGFSYYPLWHTTVSIDQISNQVSLFHTRYAKDVMILETAYPWTTAFDDSYNNSLGGSAPISGYPYSVDGQKNLMKKLVQEVRDGDGMGVIYWEPDWVTSDMRDLWNTGSSWENCTFFDFDGNTLSSIDYTEE